MELKNVYPEKIPQKILNKNYIDDIILYALSAFGPLQKAEFNQINKTTFYKYLNKLLEKKYISSFRDGKKAIYEITPSGQTELLRKLEIYKLDFETIIELEKKKINSQISKLSVFFDKYNVNDDIIKIDFLQLYNELTYDESFNIFSEEQFNKLLLFIVMNNPKFFDDPEKIISKDRFLDKFNTYIDGDLSKTDIDMFIQEVVEKNRYGEKIYNVELNDDISLFFRVNSKLGKFFETTTQSHLRDLNYLKNLTNSKIYGEDLEEIIKLILNDLTKKYRFFVPELRESLYYLIEHYIFDLQQELFGDPFIGIDKIRDFSSLFSNFPSLSFDFKSLEDSDDELFLDIHTIFKRIKEKEPMNELYDKALEFYLNEKSSESLIKINELIELEPKNYDYLRFKSQILYDLEKYDDALKIYEEALKIGFFDEDIHDKIFYAIYQAELFNKLKRYEEALDIIKNQIPAIIKEDKKQSLQEFFIEEYILFDYLKIETNIYYQQKKYRKALDVINKDLNYCLMHKDKASYSPQYTDAISESYRLKSKILFKLERTKEALVEINSAIEINPEDAKLYYQKAKILFLKSTGISFYEINRALSLDPKNEKYMKLCNDLKKFTDSITEGLQYYFELFNVMYDIINENKNNLTFSDFKKKIIESDNLKKFKFEDIEDSLNYSMKLGMLKLSKDKTIIMIDGWKDQQQHIEEKKMYKIMKNNYFLIKLIEVYKKNNWNEISRKNLISKINDDKILDYEYVNSLIDDLLGDKVLINSKSSLILFSKDEFVKRYVNIEDYLNP